MSRRETIYDNILNDVDIQSSYIKSMSDKLVQEYCKDLDTEMEEIKELLGTVGSISNKTLESFILEIANILYFTGSAQEDLGVKEDICRAIRQELYNNNRDSCNGTVADKNSFAELSVQKETVVLSIYNRAYRKVKLRMDAGYEMLASLKKILSKRITEMELSNSKYIGGNQHDEN